MADVLKWVAVMVEFAGLSLIAVELYLPRSAEQLKKVFETVRPHSTDQSETRPDWYRIAGWVGFYILIWVVVVTALTVKDPAMSISANIAFTIFTIFLFILISIGRIFVRLGVVLGRGNSVGGVGLVMALIGFSLEVSQMLST